MADNKEKSGSKISNAEWGMAVSVLGGVDALQFFLDTLGIPFLGVNVGTFANRFIDIFVGLAWPTYLYLRGVNLKSVKMSGSILLTFALEEIPDVDALPLWVLDGLFVWSVVKAEEKIKEETGVDAEHAVAVGEAEADSIAKPVGDTGEGGGNGSAETAGETGETGGGNEGEGAGGEDGPGVSDETADALGQESDAQGQGSESDNAYGDESESARTEGEEGDGDHDISDEDAEKEAQTNEAIEGEKDERNKDEDDARKDDKDKGEKKKKRGGETGEESGEQQGGGSENNPSNPLDLRGGRGGRGGDSGGPGKFHSNLLDLSLSYGERKKQRGEA